MMYINNFLRCCLLPAGVIVGSIISSYGQCTPLNTVQSERVADYKMKIILDHDKKMATGTAIITWRNPSPKAVKEIKMYMYLNAFKNMKSTWLRGTDGEIFGRQMADRSAEEWGYVTIDHIAINDGADLTSGIKYVHADGNEDDETVLLVPLPREVQSGDSIVLTVDFRSKLPKTIARSGYGENNFHLFVHWYPKLGVYEQNEVGQWGWNCHQFMQRTEFYGDFGKYDMTITCDDSFTVGASGCLIEESSTDGLQTVRYLAEDVIDFAWCVSPELEVYEDLWEDVYIKLLLPRDHRGMADRYMMATKHALQYFDEHVGRYPYPGITIMDPPFHSLRNGFMEYPTFATAGTIYGMPSWFKGSESLAIHEFAHQFFMGVLANNEKEEAWLDEGFVTYYEDRIMEAYYGQHTSQLDVFGIKYGNSALSRQEYVSMRDHSSTAIARPGWEITGDYKGIVYSKTATMLKTLENYISVEKMDEMMRAYFDEYKFTHPRTSTFVNHADRFLKSSFSQSEANIYMSLIKACLFGSDTVDYYVEPMEENVVTLNNKGALSMPVAIELITISNDTIIQKWDGASPKIIETGDAISSVHIDPQEKLYLDLNLNNNSLKIEKSSFSRYILKAITSVQHTLQSLSFFL